MCVLLPLLLLQPFFHVTNPKCAILVLGMTYYFVKPSHDLPVFTWLFWNWRANFCLAPFTNIHYLNPLLMIDFAITICPQNSALAISSGEKWWQTVLEREISWSQCEGLACTQWALVFHFGGRGGVTGIFCLWEMTN
jgi:hypothetical protein